MEFHHWAIANPKRWCCESAALNMPANLENSTVATGLEKISIIPISKKGNAKECSNYCTIALISHAKNVMLKILQARLQQYVNKELPNVQGWFRKGKGTRDRIANIHWIIEKPREFQKMSIFIQIPKKGNAKECSNYHTIVFISHASKVMLKILQARLTQFVNWELPDVQACFRKDRGTRDRIANIHWIIKKAREFQNNIYFYFDWLY